MNLAHTLTSGAPLSLSGHPPEVKTLLTIRLDAEVVRWFRATGPGWQTRMNEALQIHVRRARRQR